MRRRRREKESAGKDKELGRKRRGRRRVGRVWGGLAGMKRRLREQGKRGRRGGGGNAR